MIAEAFGGYEGGRVAVIVEAYPDLPELRWVTLDRIVVRP